MTLPLLTWRVSANYSLVPAGTSPTLTELLTAINAMLVAETALGSYWGVSNFNSGNGTLEIKRNGTQTGILDSFRALLFGGSSPNVAAMFAGVTPNASNIFGGVCENASTTGPTGSYTTGSPYPGLKWAGGGPVAAPASFSKANSIFLFMVESDEVCHIHIADSSSSACFTFGACVERLIDNTRIWCGFSSGPTHISATVPTSAFEGDSSIGMILARNTTQVNSYSNQAVGSWHDGTNQKLISRISGIGGAVGTLSVMADTSGGWLSPILVGDKIGNVSTIPSFLGQMRQMRYGPLTVNKVRIVDGSAVVQAYGVSWGAQTTARPGIYFDVQQ